MADSHIFIILDGSGSMHGVKNEVVNGTNKLIEEQQGEAAANSEDIRFTLTSFDTRVNPVYIGEEISLVNPVTVKDTYLGGGTALLDAIGKTLSEAEKDPAPRNLVVIYTDGHENASREYDKDQIRDMIQRLEDTSRWQFMYLGAEFEDFANEAAGIGVASVINTSKTGVTDTMRNVSQTFNYSKTLSDQEYATVAATGGILSASADAGVKWDEVDIPPAQVIEPDKE